MPGIYPFAQLQQKLHPVLRAFGVKNAILFGSYGKGIATERSDIDLVVDSGLRGLDFIELLDAICKTTGKAVDLLDVAHIKSGSPVALEIQETGVPFYAR